MYKKSAKLDYFSLKFCKCVVFSYFYPQNQLKIFKTLQKTLRFVSTTVLAVVFGAHFALAQAPTEALAGMPEEALLQDAPAPSPSIAETIKTEATLPIEKPTEAPIQIFQKSIKSPLVAKQVAKVEKFLNSKVGKWIVKRSIAKAERKALRQAKKHPELAQKISPDKVKEAKRLSGNLRTAAILGIVGIILTLLPSKENILALIGIILIIIALVFVLLEIL